MCGCVSLQNNRCLMHVLGHLFYLAVICPEMLIHAKFSKTVAEHEFTRECESLKYALTGAW